MKEVKIVIGANYGDEGKGLLTHYFVQKAKEQHCRPIVIFHNGTAQRGHTVDYNSTFHHVYHHFGSGTAEGVPTYYADTFLLHPMEYNRELEELIKSGIFPPRGFCDPNCQVITPFDMLVDHMTENWIAKKHGEREHGSCGYGSWCAVEGRIPMRHSDFTIKDFSEIDLIPLLMEAVWKDCMIVLAQRGVEIDKLPEYSEYFSRKTKDTLIHNFTEDIKTFLMRTTLAPFNMIWKVFDYPIFENGQGLGLDIDVDNDWHTTSHTGIYNPYQMLKDKKDFYAEVCYVSRSYLTRHGVGPLEEAARKDEINKDMHDKTNVHNDFQGDLRYGYLGNIEQALRISKDMSIVKDDIRFNHSMAFTHCNEFTVDNNAKYISNNPFEVEENR